MTWDFFWVRNTKKRWQNFSKVMHKLCKNQSWAENVCIRASQPVSQFDNLSFPQEIETKLQFFVDTKLHSILKQPYFSLILYFSVRLWLIVGITLKSLSQDLSLLLVFSTGSGKIFLFFYNWLSANYCVLYFSANLYASMCIVSIQKQ